mgnify:CR=1 FL=1
MRKEPLNGFQSELALSFPNGEVYVRVGIYIRTHHRSFTKNAYTSLDLQERYYERFLDQCRQKGFRVEHGEFGADMKVASVNDGPVTILFDTEQG